jgi:hypothetical protein
MRYIVSESTPTPISIHDLQCPLEEFRWTGFFMAKAPTRRYILMEAFVFPLILQATYMELRHLL